MKKLTILSGIALGFFLTLTLASLPNSAHAQKKMVMSVGGEGIEGQPFIIPELGAIVVFKEKKLEVLNVMPDNARPKDYLEVDIKAGDILVMLNGARLKTIEDLKSAHDSASAGDNFKFGIKRGKEMRILQFAKADPKSMPKGHAMTMSMDAEGGGGKPLAVLMGSGIIAEESDGKIVIGALMPDASDIFADAAVSKGDQIISIQGTKFDDLDKMSEFFEGIAVGDEVKMELVSGEKAFTVTFKKREPSAKPGMMMIK